MGRERTGRLGHQTIDEPAPPTGFLLTAVCFVWMYRLGTGTRKSSGDDR